MHPQARPAPPCGCPRPPGAASTRAAAATSSGVVQVLLVGRLAAVGARHPRGVVDGAPAEAATEPAEVGPMAARTPRPALVGRLRELGDGLDAHAASRSPILGPTPHRAVVGRSPITSNQLSRVSRKVPRGLPKSVAILARTMVSPMPTEQCRPVAASTSAWTSRAVASGSSVSTPTNASSQPSTSTTAPGCAAASPSPRRRRLVGREVDGQEHRVGPAPLRRLQRHPATARRTRGPRRTRSRPPPARSGRRARPRRRAARPARGAAAARRQPGTGPCRRAAPSPRHPPILARRSDTGAPLGAALQTRGQKSPSAPWSTPWRHPPAPPRSVRALRPPPVPEGSRWHAVGVRSKP